MAYLGVWATTLYSPIEKRVRFDFPLALEKFSHKIHIFLSVGSYFSVRPAVHLITSRGSHIVLESMLFGIIVPLVFDL